MGPPAAPPYVAAEITLAHALGLSTQEDRRFFLLIPAVGVIGGLFAIGIDYLLDGVRALLWGGSGSFLVLGQTAPLWRVLAAPTAGRPARRAAGGWSKQPVSGQGMALLDRGGGAAAGRCRRGRC